MNHSKSSQPTSPRLVNLAQRILTLHEAEIDCECCCEHLECLADLITVGGEAQDILPAVQMHIDCCADCREEFEALLVILRAEQAGKC
jgi:hypothetical protein